MEALKDIDQFVRFKLQLGADAEEILTSDKPLVEHLLSGFNCQYEVSFLKQLKKAFAAGLEGSDNEAMQAIIQMSSMVGPAFKFSSNV